MSDFRKLSDSVLASPQVTPADIAEAKAEGVTLIVNNRPDGEAADQPAGAEIERAAREAGIDYKAIPITPGGFGQAEVEDMGAALASADGKVLAYCRTGTRSTFLWSLAQARAGQDPDAIAAAASDAGYDISPIRSALDALKAQQASR